MQFTTSDLKPLLANWAEIMTGQKDKLIDMDSIVGDGDLGLTMSDGFTAAYDEIKNSSETDIGKFFYAAGKRMSTAVPSTMGTLMASGLMQIGKAFKGQDSMKETDFATLFAAYFDGVQARGKAQVGEKTFLDGLYPDVEQLKADVAKNNNWTDSAKEALKAAQAGVEHTTTLIAVHGRAATRGENSRSLIDPGAYVAQLLLEGYAKFAEACK